MYRVAGVRGAFREGFVAHVHGVVAFFGDIGPPDDGSAFLPGGGGRLPGRSHPEGVLVHQVNGFPVCEALSGVLPVALFRVVALSSEQACALFPEGRIVVADHLIGLRVPFAWGDDHGARVLQHGNQEREHKALSEKVFHGPVGGRPLPFPAVCLGLPVAAVALPKGDVAAAEALRPVVGPLNQRDGIAARIRHLEGGGAGLAVAGERGHG